MDRQQISLKSAYDIESESGVSLTLESPVSSTIILCVGSLETIMRRRWREVESRSGRAALVDNCHDLLWQYFSFAGYVISKVDTYRSEDGIFGHQYNVVLSKK